MILEVKAACRLGALLVIHGKKATYHVHMKAIHECSSHFDDLFDGPIGRVIHTAHSITLWSAKIDSIRS